MVIYMNILGAKGAGPISLGIAPKGAKSLGLVDGQIYEGTITAKEKGKFSIQLEDGFAFDAKANNIDKNVGDKVKLMASKSESGSFTLRILDFSRAKNTGGNLTPCQTKDLFKQSGFITEESIQESGLNSEDAKAQEQARLAAARIQSKLAYATDNLTMHAVNELLANGVSIQKLNLSMLNSVLKKVKESPQAISEEAMDKLINDSMKEHGIDIKAMEESEKFAKGLLENALPVNADNLEFMEKSFKLYEAAQPLSDASIAGLIKAGGEITLTGLYSANHIAAVKNEKADMELLNKDLPRLLEGMGISDTPETRENAALLFEYDLAITRENIEKVEYIKTFAAAGEERLVKAAASAIKEGVKPENIVLTDFADKENLANTYKEIMEFLPGITSRQVAYINSANIPMTLFNLRNISVPENFAYENQSGDSRHMLIQIQHKLTNEAAQRLIGKGINIDTMPVNKALNEIKTAQIEALTATLEDIGAQASPQNIAGLTNTMDTLHSLKYIMPSAYNALAQGNSRFTMADISMAARTADILETIENLTPEPSAKYGDSLEKIRNSVNDILESLGFPLHETNRKNAEILVKSGLDFNRENMLKVSIIDLKISRVYEGLQPEVAAHMIKSGFDPLNSHIDTVIDYIDDYNAEYSENPKDSIAEAIYQMDKEGRLEESERKSLIALYKMLGKIEKDSFSAIGLNLRAGHMPTLRSFMDMAALKTDTTREISQSGYNESLPSDTEKALNQISFKSIDHEQEYANLVMKSFAGKINRENLDKLMKEPSLMDKPLEELVDYILEDAGEPTSIVNQEEAMSAFNDMKNVLAQKHDLFTFFESIGMPATISNIKTYLSLKGSSYFSDAIADIAEQIEDSPSRYSVDIDNTDMGEETQPHEAMAEAAERLEQAVLDSGKATMLKEVRLLQNAVKVQNAIAKRQNNFKVPVEIGGKTGQLNMFMPNGYVPSHSQINLAISINIGGASVSAMCMLDGNTAKITLDIEAIETKNKKDVEKKLNEALKSYGLKGSLTGYGQLESLSGELELLPELARNHKESMFNIGKAMMKFADNIFSD